MGSWATPGPAAWNSTGRQEVSWIVRTVLLSGTSAHAQKELIDGGSGGAGAAISERVVGDLAKVILIITP